MPRWHAARIRTNIATSVVVVPVNTQAALDQVIAVRHCATSYFENASLRANSSKSMSLVAAKFSDPDDAFASGHSHLRQHEDAPRHAPQVTHLLQPWLLEVHTRKLNGPDHHVSLTHTARSPF